MKPADLAQRLQRNLQEMTIPALFVETDGIYFNDPRIDPWDVKRDAMKFTGPGPVIAHPPCARWCSWAKNIEKRYGHKVGDDGGMFASACHLLLRRR